MAELRILIADDHQLIRRGLRDLLTTQSGWQVVGEASNGLDAVEMAVRLKPDIAILDFSMPGLNGPGATARIGSARIRAEKRCRPRFIGGGGGRSR
jgi:DNA-binding NarL/FixJ family response regulator